MTEPEVRIRRRTDADLEPLVDVLARQQPFSKYPFQWPMSVPATDFLKRSSEISSWVADLGGRPVGHVAVTAVAGRDADVQKFAVVWSAATCRPPEELQCVSALFLDQQLQGRGIGGSLLRHAVAQIVRAGSTPVLDVVDADGRAAAIYRHHGWREVGRIHPSWLPDPDHRVLLMVLDPSDAAARLPATAATQAATGAATRSAIECSTIDSPVSGTPVDATNPDQKEC